jgi:hypothetical protein
MTRTDGTAIRPSELLLPAAFAAVRPARLAEILEIKRRRRLTVNADVSILFESRATALWQMQEMIRAENANGLHGVRQQIAAFAHLVPNGRELVATIFIEFNDPARIREELTLYAGLDIPEHVVLEIDGEESPGDFTAAGAAPPISSVHFVHFALTPAQAEGLRSVRTAALHFRHPHLTANVPIPLALAGDLASDLVI